MKNFCCKIHKKTSVTESLFNKVTVLYPATSLKERTPTQMFSHEFCEILKTPFFQNTSRRLLLFCENRKEHSEKRKKILKKWKQLERKTTTHPKQKLNPLTTNIPHHIETSQLICNQN